MGKAMNCEECRKAFSQYLDEMLTSEERAAIEGHLGACPGCERELAMWRRTLDAVRELPRRSAPSGFASGVAERIRGESSAAARATPRFRRRVIVLRWAAAAAVLLLVFCAAFTLGRHSLTSRQAVPPRVAALEEKVGAVAAMEEATEPEGDASGLVAARSMAAGMAREPLRARGSRPAGPEAAGVRVVSGGTGTTNGLYFDRDDDKMLSELGLGERAAEAFHRYTFVQDPPSRLKTAVAPQEPVQVLVLHSRQQVAVAFQAIHIANRNGFPPERLSFGPFQRGAGPAIEVSLTVPAERYQDLVDQLLALAPGEKERHRGMARAEREVSAPLSFGGHAPTASTHRGAVTKGMAVEKESADGAGEVVLDEVGFAPARVTADKEEAEAKLLRKGGAKREKIILIVRILAEIPTVSDAPPKAQTE